MQEALYTAVQDVLATRHDFGNDAATGAGSAVTMPSPDRRLRMVDEEKFDSEAAGAADLRRAVESCDSPIVLHEAARHYLNLQQPLRIAREAEASADPGGSYARAVARWVEATDRLLGIVGRA